MKISDLILIAFCCFSLSACSGILDSLREESRDAQNAAVEEKRVARLNSSASYKGFSANNNPNHNPRTRREYREKRLNYTESANRVRRYGRSDFIDGVENANSLWKEDGQTNYLFSHNNRRNLGDLITVDVGEQLRREIQYALWLTLPPEQRKFRKKRTPANAGGAKGAVASAKEGLAAAKDEAQRAAKENITKSKNLDVVRTEVTESLGNGLVRLIGRKKVIYRGIPRVVEVSGLVRSDDIGRDNLVTSSNFLDTRAQVVQ